jgi:hypothetical protein
MSEHRLRKENKPEESYDKRVEDIIADLREQVRFYKNELELIKGD